MTILTNQSVLHSRRAVNHNFANADAAMKQVSSGSRLVDPKVDPSGKVNFEKIKGSISQLEQIKKDFQQTESIFNILNSDAEILLNIIERGKVLLSGLGNTVTGDKNSFREEFKSLLGSNGTMEKIIKANEKLFVRNAASQVSQNENSEIYNARLPQNNTFSLDKYEISNVRGEVKEIKVSSSGDNYQTRFVMSNGEVLSTGYISKSNVSPSQTFTLYGMDENENLNRDIYIKFNFASNIDNITNEGGEVNIDKLNNTLKHIFISSDEKNININNSKSYLRGMNVHAYNANSTDLHVLYNSKEKNFTLFKDGVTFSTQSITSDSDFSQNIEEFGLEIKLNSSAVEELLLSNQNSNYVFEFKNNMRIGLNDSNNLDFLSFDMRKLGLSGLDVSNDQGVKNAFEMLNNATEKVSSILSQSSNLMNLAEFKTKSIDIQIDSMQIFAGSINDADVPEAVTELTKASVLAQSSMAMLVQANAQLSLFLKMLA